MIKGFASSVQVGGPNSSQVWLLGILASGAAKRQCSCYCRIKSALLQLFEQESYTLRSIADNKEKHEVVGYY